MPAIAAPHASSVFTTSDPVAETTDITITSPASQRCTGTFSSGISISHDGNSASKTIPMTSRVSVHSPVTLSSPTRQARSPSTLSVNPVKRSPI